MMLAVPADSYGLRHASDPSFFEGRCAEIYLKKSGQVVGLFGTVHPEVLRVNRVRARVTLSLSLSLTLTLTRCSATSTCPTRPRPRRSTCRPSFSCTPLVDF